MRNRWGVDVKRGHWVMAHAARGGVVEGRVTQVMTTGEYARAYGPTVALDSGVTVALDDVVQTLGPMKVAKDGTVIQNPLSRVKVGSKSQRTKTAPTKRLKARRRVTEKAPPGFYGNPLARVEIESPSQRPHLSPYGKLTTTPDPRLIKRRRKTAKTRVKGVWANPTSDDRLPQYDNPSVFWPPKHYGDPSALEWFLIEVKASKEKRFRRHATFARSEEAKIYARALHNAHPNWTIRISDER